jgi:hypothetical protein
MANLEVFYCHALAFSPKSGFFRQVIINRIVIKIRYSINCYSDNKKINLYLSKPIETSYEYSQGLYPEICYACRRQSVGIFFK